jgi:hypothetical protein
MTGRRSRSPGPVPQRELRHRAAEAAATQQPIAGPEA